MISKLFKTKLKDFAKKFEGFENSSDFLTLSFSKQLNATKWIKFIELSKKKYEKNSQNCWIVIGEIFRKCFQSLNCVRNLKSFDSTWIYLKTYLWLAVWVAY